MLIHSVDFVGGGKRSFSSTTVIDVLSLTTMESSRERLECPKSVSLIGVSLS